jgi:signal transduction histidine kinase
VFSGIYKSFERDINESLVPFFIITTISIIFICVLIVYLMSRDSLKKIQNEQLRIKKFVSDASHDLRTPLSVIQGYSELLLAQQKDNEKIKKIVSNSKRMNNLIEELLQLARLDVKDVNQIINISKVNLNELLLQEIELFNEKAKGKLEFSLIYREKEPIIFYSDKEKLRRIFQNIYDNAFKYAYNDFDKSNNFVKTYVKGDSNGVEIKISDNVAGVPKDQQKKIFNRFYTVDTERSNKTHGLGLAIVYELVSLLNGRVRAYSTTKKSGLGLTIEIYFNFK